MRKGGTERLSHKGPELGLSPAELIFLITLHITSTWRSFPVLCGTENNGSSQYRSATQFVHPCHGTLYNQEKGGGKRVYSGMTATVDCGIEGAEGQYMYHVICVA